MVIFSEFGANFCHTGNFSLLDPVGKQNSFFSSSIIKFLFIMGKSCHFDFYYFS